MESAKAATATEGKGHTGFLQGEGRSGLQKRGEEGAVPGPGPGRTTGTLKAQLESKSPESTLLLLLTLRTRARAHCPMFLRSLLAGLSCAWSCLFCYTSAATLVLVAVPFCY